MTSSYDVIIVGAGIAGCPLGVALANQGRKVLVLERDLSEPDRIVGELLQPKGLEHLRSLGMGECIEGIDAIEVTGYGLLYEGDRMGMTYPVDDNGKENKGVSFHHGRFVSKLREYLKKTKNATLQQGTVLNLVHEEEGNTESRVIGVSVRRGDSEEPVTVRAPVTVVCDGCHSRFRKNVAVVGDEQPRIDVNSHFVGAILTDVKLPYDHCGNVFLVKPSPVLMYQIGTHDTRVLVDIPGAKLPKKDDLEKYMLEKIAPQLVEEVRDEFVRAIKAGDLRSMPNQYMSARQVRTPGVFLLGDSNNMRHPLTGGGMTVALSDVVNLAALWEPIKDLTDFDAVEATRTPFFESRKEKVSSINVLSAALYEVFSVPNPDFEQLRAACFYYLKAGGIWLRGPVGLLSGLRSSPSLLIAHFFSVAAYGMYRICTPIPTPGKVWLSLKLICEAAGIMVPLFVRERASWLYPIGRLIYGSGAKQKAE